MSLATGQALSFYEILGPLGAGGMGEVYLARDARLEREVAIKILPEEVADDEERLRRFEREAKTLASLNHPNVAGIHGVDQEGDVCFLALELVPGEDLGARVVRGPLPLDEALDVCRQIAEGLEAAHEAGVVHRDLKPANVRVTPEGVVKILDFGLAKPLHPRADKVGTTTAQSDSFLMTEEGLVLGTPTYMSPEQARGRPVDRRTDIWAFGCVLYECLTGKRAFEGQAFGDLIAAILGDEVDLDALPSEVPRHVRDLIARCLVKDPRRRLRDIGEARLTLESTSTGAPVASTSSSEGRKLAGGSPVTWMATTILVLAAAFAGWRARGQSEAPREQWSKFTQLTDLVGAETGPTLSPDGNSFAYSSRVAGSWDIYVQRVGGRTRTAVAADPDRDEAWPAFSPDGSHIAYNESGDEGGIWIVGATGESQRRLTDFGFNPAWSPDGEEIAFTTGEVLTPYEATGSKLWKVAVSGGEPVQLHDGHAYQPAWSPSGERIAIWFHEGGQRDLATVPANGGDRLLVLEDAPLDWSPTWSPDGRHLYFSSDRGGTLGLWRIAIDEASGRAEGAPEFVAGGLDASAALPSFSEDGSALAFRSETVTITPCVIPFDPVTEELGVPRELLQRTGILRPTGVSPDGEWLALSNRGEHREDLFLMRADGTDLRRLTDDAARDRSAVFSPDGSLVTFHSNRGGTYLSCSIRVDGSARTELTDVSLGNTAFPSFQPGGNKLLVYVQHGGWALAEPPWPAAKDSATPLGDFSLPTGEFRPEFKALTWSPNGRMLVGEGDEAHSGVSAGIAIFDLTSGEGRLLTTEQSESGVYWLPDNRRILFFSHSGELVIIDVETKDRRSIPVDLPHPLAGESVAVGPDGTAIYFGAERIESNVWMVERGR